MSKRAKVVLSVVGVFVVLGVIGSFVDEPAERDDGSTSTSEPASASEDGDDQGGEGVSVPQSAIDTAEQSAAEHDIVSDAHISVDGDEVTIALVTIADEGEAKRLLEQTARRLATQAAIDGEPVEPPDSDSLGGLWDHYDLALVAGPSPDDVLVRGAKVTSSPRITW